MCDKDLLIPDVTGEIMPVFKSDEI